MVNDTKSRHSSSEPMKAQLPVHCAHTHISIAVNHGHVESSFSHSVAQRFQLSSSPTEVDYSSRAVHLESWEYLVLPKVSLVCYISLSLPYPLLQSLVPTKIAPPSEQLRSHGCPHLPAPERLLQPELRVLRGCSALASSVIITVPLQTPTGLF